MLKKAVKRIRDPIGSLSIAQNSSWLASNKSEFEVLANELDRDLWQESLEAADVIDKNATRTLESIEHSLGGGGAYPFLFFLTR